MEKDIAVNTQGNALFCTILCCWKGRMPFCFESTNFVMCFSQKNIGKLSSFLLASFSCCFFLMVYPYDVLGNQGLFHIPFEQRLNLITELILSSWSNCYCYCLRPCKWIDVMSFSVLKYYALFYYFFGYACPPCSQSACKLGSPPPSFLFWKTFAHISDILQAKIKTIKILYCKSFLNIYCWYDTRYLLMKYFDWTAIYIGLYIENSFVILEVPNISNGFIICDSNVFFSKNFFGGLQNKQTKKKLKNNLLICDAKRKISHYFGR